MDAFEETIGATATKDNPWHVIPADQKFVARYLASEAILKALKTCGPHYPELGKDEIAAMEACRQRLVGAPPEAPVGVAVTPRGLHDD